MEQDVPQIVTSVLRVTCVTGRVDTVLGTVRPGTGEISVIWVSTYYNSSVNSDLKVSSL